MWLLHKIAVEHLTFKSLYVDSLLTHMQGPDMIVQGFGRILVIAVEIGIVAKVLTILLGKVFLRVPGTDIQLLEYAIPAPPPLSVQHKNVGADLSATKRATGDPLVSRRPRKSE